MMLERLRDFTPARVALGRSGHSLPTRGLLDFQLAHARAIDAVHRELDARQLAFDLQSAGRECLVASSAARDRSTYIRRPDLGRRLDERSRQLLSERADAFDAVFVVADGLSALAAQLHAIPLLERLLPALDSGAWRLAPIVIVERGRVAVGDEIARCLGAAQCAVLIGERPGLSSPDSLGIYLTWNPRAETTDADRNCISNIRAEGLGYAAAAHKLAFLMSEARRRKLSGVGLKEDSKAIEQGPL
jgi:ethanolamine ammonia-lyase small subunit